MERAKAIYVAAGAKWQAQRSRFVWPSGAMLYFRHLDRDADADLYQGHSYTRVYVEELTQFAAPGVVDKLKATLRSAAGATCGFRATCNPGGAGHNWVKARYIDVGPWNKVERAGLTQMFIPARLADNPKLADSDPGYVDRLRQSGSATLVKAWLEGDWNVVEGAFFDAWSPRNIVAPFTIPPFWARIRSLDWGSAAPFSVGWWAIASDPTPVGDVVIPRGAMIRYREWYGARDGEGLRLTAEEVAAGILARERARRSPTRWPTRRSSRRMAALDRRKHGAGRLLAAAGRQHPGRQAGGAERLGSGAGPHRRPRWRTPPLRLRDLPRLHPHRAGLAARSAQARRPRHGGRRSHRRRGALRLPQPDGGGQGAACADRAAGSLADGGGGGWKTM